MNLLEAVEALKQGNRVMRSIDYKEITYCGGRIRLKRTNGRKGPVLAMIKAWLEAEYCVVTDAVIQRMLLDILDKNETEKTK